MSVNQDIAQSIEALSKRGEGTAIFTAEVTGVDVATRTCSVLGIGDKAGIEYTEVLLMAVVNDGIFYTPKEGSIVLVGNNKNQQPFVLMFSELDGITDIVGDTELNMIDGAAFISQNDLKVMLSGSKLSIKNDSQDFKTILQDILTQVKNIANAVISPANILTPSGNGQFDPATMLSVNNAIAEITADSTKIDQLLS